jgi:hypothetical protein
MPVSLIGTEPFEYQPHAGDLMPGIDPRGLNQLDGQLDDERFAARNTTLRGDLSGTEPSDPRL